MTTSFTSRAETNARSLSARIESNFAKSDVEAQPALPSDVHWNTPELLRIDALLMVWHDAPGALAAAEAKLLRALEIARGQAVLSWDLRTAMSLAGLWRRHGRAAEARDLLAAAYEKLTEGFGTCDWIHAREMMMNLESYQPPA